MSSEIQVALISIAGIIVGAIIRPLMQMWLSPRRKRQVLLAKEADKRLQQSPVYQQITGPVQQQFNIYFQATTTAMNSEYIATGTGHPLVPDPTQFWDPHNNRPVRGPDAGRDPRLFTGIIHPAGEAAWCPPMNTKTDEQD